MQDEFSALAALLTLTIAGCEARPALPLAGNHGHVRFRFGAGECRLQLKNIGAADRFSMALASADGGVRFELDGGRLKVPRFYRIQRGEEIVLEKQIVFDKTTEDRVIRCTHIDIDGRVNQFAECEFEVTVDDLTAGWLALGASDVEALERSFPRNDPDRMLTVVTWPETHAFWYPAEAGAYARDPARFCAAALSASKSGMSEMIAVPPDDG